MPGKQYSMDEIDIIIRGAEARESDAAIAAKIGRSANAVRLQRRDMCLSTDPKATEGNMARIDYPAIWGQSARDDLDHMFAVARTKRLWFFHGGLSGPLWFSPDELEAEQKGEKFVWGAANWTLRNPLEYLQEADHVVERAKIERESIGARLSKAGVLTEGK